MIEIRQILCPTDFSEFSARALQHALTLARWYEAAITVVHVTPPPVAAATGGFPLPVPMAADPGVRERLQAELARFVEGGGGEEARLEVAVREGEPVREILEAARERRADVLVMGTHGRGGFERWVLGSVAEKVLRKAPCPVLTVSRAAEGTAPAVAFKSILCPTDFSESSLKAVEYALSFAQEADAELRLLHVLTGLPEPWKQVVPDQSDHVARLGREAEQRLGELIPEGARDWCTPTVIVAAGKPHAEILRAAEEGTDLIVMGVQGRGPIDLMLFGSTTHHVVRAAGCPVLTIRSAGPPPS